MPRRKGLKGIASGIASGFCSRNNDVDGYWAMGILYKLTIDSNLKKFDLELLSGKSVPEFQYSKQIAAPYTDYLFQQLGKRCFGVYQVSKVVVEVEFNVAPTTTQIMFKSTWGNPYICRVVITDDLGKEHTREERGWCGIHDPTIEHRSTRRYAL